MQDTIKLKEWFIYSSVLKVVAEMFNGVLQTNQHLAELEVLKARSGSTDVKVQRKTWLIQPLLLCTGQTEL
jgi:hypothetical protein